MASNDGVEEIQPDGDLLLICGEGENEKKMLVASAIMMRSSVVFTAMLSSGSNDLTIPSAGEPTELRLPRDDPDSMSIICRFLHHVYDELPDRVSIKRLCQLAELTEKYGFGMDMKAVAHRWIGIIKGNRLFGGLEYEKLFIIAYFFQCGKVFEDLANHMILNSGRALPNLQEGFAMPLPKNLLDAFVEIKRQISAARRGMANVIGYVIVQESDLRHEYDSLCTPSCSYAERRLHYFLNSLIDAKLWPKSIMNGYPLEQAAEVIQALPLSTEDMSESMIGNVCGAPPGKCVDHLAPAIEDSHGKLIRKSKKACEDARGICYQCARNGKSLGLPCEHVGV